MKKMIMIGGGGHASVLQSILDMDETVQCIGYVDHKESTFQHPYLGTDDCLNQYSPDDIFLVNGVGSVKRALQRQNIFTHFKQRGFSFHSVIHPKTILAKNITWGEGVQVMAGVIVNPGVSLGDNVLVNTGAILDHDCSIEAHTHIAPGTTLSGNVFIGKGCHMGTGSTVIQGIRIGDYCTIGAGSVVLKDIESFSFAAGVPATLKEKYIQ